MKKDILDLLTDEQLAVIEGAAYAMLHKHGYPVKGARKDGRVRARLKNALQRRGHELVYSCAPCSERGVYRLSFALRGIEGEEIDKTKTFRLVFGGEKKEEGNENA
jgi:hypothetical protein